jgi:uncharacterized protein (UPF0332 family)
MTPEQSHLLSESKSSIEAANVLKREGYFGFATSRAYYAMFYAVQAILLSKGLASSKHAGVISAFGQHFVKTGEVPPEYHRYLIQGMELRHVGDYGRSHEISSEQCDQQIRRAQEFLSLAGQILGLIA